jgi:hypothetical protein
MPTAVGWGSSFPPMDEYPLGAAMLIEAFGQ